MYLHLGQDTVVPKKIVIGIYDLENTSHSHITRGFLSSAESEGKVINVSEELPRSFVVCNEKGKENVYISQLSAATLLKRWENSALLE